MGRTESSSPNGKRWVERIYAVERQLAVERIYAAGRAARGTLYTFRTGYAIILRVRGEKLPERAVLRRKSGRDSFAG